MRPSYVRELARSALGGLLLTAVAVSRLASLALYPLMDVTEARYANIARVMSETDNWITPQTAPGEPFWGKPPLFAWASAAAMKVFGINEFSAQVLVREVGLPAYCDLD